MTVHRHNRLSHMSTLRQGVLALLCAGCMLTLAAENNQAEPPADTSSPNSAGTGLSEARPSNGSATAASSVVTHRETKNARAAAKDVNTSSKTQTRPSWSELTKNQKLALEPLANGWEDISEEQKRKWLALSQNFHKLSDSEKAKVHSRMAEWVALSVRDRIQARLNYAQAQKLAPEDKQAQWEAYQALSEEEKQKLLSQAAQNKVVGAAPLPRPVPASKLAPVAAPKSEADLKHGARIETGPHQVNMNTLLPQPSGKASN